MKSDEQRITEAVAALRARLDSWGVEDANEKAAVYVNDMLRNGWRPRALPVEQPKPATGGCKPTPEYLTARAGRIRPEQCNDHKQQPAESEENTDA